MKQYKNLKEGEYHKRGSVEGDIGTTRLVTACLYEMLEKKYEDPATLKSRIQSVEDAYAIISDVFKNLLAYGPPQKITEIYIEAVELIDSEFDSIKTSIINRDRAKAEMQLAAEKAA
jgi:hypothetical protein